jgi:hypothetical protein
MGVVVVFGEKEIIIEQSGFAQTIDRLPLDDLPKIFKCDETQWPVELAKVLDKAVTTGWEIAQEI